MTLVRGVTLLNTMETGISHYLDCISNTTSPGNLRWARQGGGLRFTPTVLDDRKLRLDFAPKTGQDVNPIMSSDLGVYVCEDTTTDESVSVTIVEGMYM